MGTILIVDDNLDGSRPLARLLKYAGHTGVCVDSGEAALSWLNRDLPDLVILDVMMPGMDGMEVLRRIRGEQRTQRLPVVLFSAISDPQFRTHAREKGADDYWVKSGLDLDELIRRVNAFVKPPPDAPAQ